MSGFMSVLGWLLGIEELRSVHGFELRFAAPWAQQRPALLLFAAAALAAVSILYYYRFEAPAHRRRTLLLAALRALILSLLAVILAEPVLALRTVDRPRSLLLVLMDGSDSMNIRDRLSTEDRNLLTPVVGDTSTTEPGGPRLDASRLELAARAVAGPRARVLDDLASRFRLRAYQFDRPDMLREIDLHADSLGRPDPARVAGQLSAPGKVTAIGAALSEIGRRHQGQSLAGVLLLSDFDQNAGPPALAAAQKLDAPVFAVGLGQRETVDAALEFQAPLIVKKDELTGTSVRIRQTGLTGRTAEVQLLARRLGSASGGESDSAFVAVAPPRRVTLDRDQLAVDIPFTPASAGRFILQARVTPLDDEVLTENNTAERPVTVRDESLKLLFVEYEPTWEWRFIKEVFHRDRLIGMEGFRTFLRSADFKVRRSNPLFLETLVRPRAEFFAYDVIFLSDVPPDMLSEHFQSLLQEYVSKFGGGLVVLSGPRFGPAALAKTKIADMLPVVIDPAAALRDRPFWLQFTPAGNQADFLQLGSSPREHDTAWRAMGQLPWYQPVARPHPLASVLAQHPVDKCVDGQTPQPVIATRRYGNGEVVYLGFNETWRLRRMFGEKYYRQLWGQMIYRLGLGRALGSQKRFIVSTDRRQYPSGERVRLRVEAYNADFEPLSLPHLEARVIAPADGSGPSGTDAADPASASDGPATTRLPLPLARDKVVFETTFPVFAEGSYRVLVRDPVTREEVEHNFKVAPVTAERRNAVRDAVLQKSLADRTGGRALELHELPELARTLEAPRSERTTEHRLPLWNTWLVFLLVTALMFAEWTLRKLTNLR